LPLRAHCILGSLSRWVPRHRRLPPSGFRNLSTVCSPRRFTGLFHPASTSRLFPSGSFPRQEPSRLVAETLPSCGYLRRSFLLRGGVARSPASGPCSPGESVAFNPRLSESSARYPLGLSPLQGIPLFGRRLRFHNLPLTSLPVATYETWDAAPLRVFPGPKDGPSLAR